MKRIEGYYWCNHYDKWDIFRFDGFEWWYAGWEGPFEESEFIEIDERRVERLADEHGAVQGVDVLK